MITYKLYPNVAVTMPEMSWPSVHSACTAAYNARYGDYLRNTGTVTLTAKEAMALATVANAYQAIFSEYRTLKQTLDIVSAIRKACRDESCEFCENH